MTAYAGLREPRFPITLRTHSGITLELREVHDVLTAWVILFRQEYTVRHDDRLILDLGANIGAFSAYAAWKAPRASIHAFEPFPATLERLRGTIATNGLGDRVTVHGVALGDRDGERRMDTSEGPSPSRGLLSAEADRGGIVVPTRALGAWIRDEIEGPIDLMKIDIEGGEHDVLGRLEGDAFARIRRLSLEYHPPVAWPARAKARLFERIEGEGLRLQRDLAVGPCSGVAEFAR